MNAVESSRVIKMNRLDNGEWLKRLLAEIEGRNQIPSQDAVERIRRRVHLTIVHGESSEEAA